MALARTGLQLAAKSALDSPVERIQHGFLIIVNPPIPPFRKLLQSIRSQIL